MTPTPQLLEPVAPIVLTALLVAFALLLVRLVRGPGLADRVVAVDTAAYLIVGLAAAVSLATGQAAFLDVGLVVGLVAFLGTVAFGRHISRRDRVRVRDPEVTR